MNNRQTLLLLAILTGLTGIGRLWTGARLSSYEEGLEDSKADYKKIWENVNVINQRRENYLNIDTESKIRTHFQQQAQWAGAGTVRVMNREKPRGNYMDQTFTIEFENDNPVFTREQLANFLYNSAHLVPRMRSTQFGIIPAGRSGQRSRGVQTGSERADVWKLTKLEFTQRTPTAKDS